ncbi:MAG TPA: tetratricopeptide repeat protein [Phycisphaerae bacterium]|jgi:tetratricopeptide (TPR) repeat protein|nr:tetratricopeptide repeat protein [Phycisphaerae bacterium]HOB73122.1 tetratricopeptide repeat protein [Phycisphaerae bacterium]HOJ53998.1 tetratricopeptide repeat protein [Phycisphaerae bacterium]HOL26409.1 tetratricopeptide repeat protein [Phycisphaerae bacterium]HPP20388.1 tetratricopeptide repeat protein [Phycisphaerae bacterium]
MFKLAKRARQFVRHPFRVAAEPFRAAEQVASKATHVKPQPGERSILVWQWTGHKYRIRAIAFLLINMALFGGLGCFTFWLRTGNYSPLTQENYWQCWKEAFSPTHVPPVTLIDFLTYPIPVDQAPLMLIIVGLVLASLTAIPILVSMLYRFPCALPFTLIICFIAVVPWLAITVTFCCFLARWRPLRFSFHYATALISLLPLVAYYALATRGSGLSSPTTGPMEMAALYLPWVLALIGACIVMAIVLIVAKVVNYRPGAIVPSMVVLFAVPVILFETQVGRDELYYRLLEVRYGPRSTEYFVDYADASRTVEHIAERRLKALRKENPGADLASVTEQVQLVMELQWSQVRPDLAVAEEQLTEGQWEAVRQCDKFLARYPHSRYCPNVLYLKGRVLDMRVDRAYFRQKSILRHYWDFPCEASLDTWKALRERQESPLWGVAAYRVALLEARRGNVDAAVTTLTALLEKNARWQQRSETSSGSASWTSFFAKRPPVHALDVDPLAVLLEARKLHSLIVNNRDPAYRDLPLITLLRLNPRHPMYQANLKELLAEIPNRYPLTRLRDNIEVLIASESAGASKSRRIELLKSCLVTFSRQPGSDALPQARFELGMAYKEDSRFEEARAAFEELCRDTPDSPWAAEARKQLAAMGVGRNSG